MSTVTRRVRSTPILRLSRRWAEWLDFDVDGRPTLERRGVEGDGPHDLARAALEAAAGAPRGRRRCIVALADGLLKQRVIELPPMAAASRCSVLERKAAGLLDRNVEQVLYAALEMADDGRARGASASSRWLLVAQERAFAVQLRTALEAGDLRPLRVVSESLAHLDHAQGLRRDVGPACVVIDVGDEEVGVGLIARTAVHHMTVLAGSLSSTPALAVTMLHELRTLDAFWRKESRGGVIEQVVLLGLDADRSEALGAAMRTVLPMATLIADPAERGVSGAGRLASIAACAARGPFTLETGARRPLRTSRLLVVGTVLLALLGSIAAYSQRGSAREAGRLREQASILAREGADLEGLRASTAAAREAIARLDQEVRRLERTAALGLDFEGCLREIFLACGRDATPLSIRVRAPWDGRAGELVVSGRTSADPLESTRRLARVAERLQRSPSFEAVEVLVPDSLPEPSKGESELHFGLAARLPEERTWSN